MRVVLTTHIDATTVSPMEPRALPAKPIVRGGPRPAHDWGAIAQHLRKHPDIWFEVATFSHQTNEAHRIKTGANPAFREGRWDAMRERTADGFTVYACYLGAS